MAKENLGRKIKKGAYGAVSVVDKQLDKAAKQLDEVAGRVRDGEGSLGRTVKDIKEIAEDIKMGVGGLASEVKKQVEPMHKDIKACGGYIAAAKRTGKTIVDSVKDAYGALEKSVKDNFFTDDKFDSEKAKQRLKDSENAIKQYGIKGYKYLSKLTADGARALNKSYHEFIPTKEELATKYAGIGTKYSSVLFKEQCDKCLVFYRKTERKIPKRAKFRAEILKDIKSSASVNKTELKKFYARQVTQDDKGVYAHDKLKTIKKYL